MCLLFLSIDNEAGPDDYQIVLVNNRDEYWNRPTKEADFWSDNQQCISGRDEHPGREGGTWLGMNKNGRIGILLNILQPQLPDKKGRGFLVNDFITSQEDANSYVKRLGDVKHQYNGFHLLLLDKQNGKYDLNFLTTSSNVDDNKVQIAINECIGIGNSAYTTPWKKISRGREDFHQLVNKYTSTNQKQHLIDNLIQIMSNKSQFKSDPILYEQAKDIHPLPVIHERSAEFVWSPSIQYGTRTTTVILITGDGNCDYIEKTLLTPVNVPDPKFTTKTFQFKIS